MDFEWSDHRAVILKISPQQPERCYKADKAVPDPRIPEYSLRYKEVRDAIKSEWETMGKLNLIFGGSKANGENRDRHKRRWRNRDRVPRQRQLHNYFLTFAVNYTE